MDNGQEGHIQRKSKNINQDIVIWWLIFSVKLGLYDIDIWIVNLVLECVTYWTNGTNHKIMGVEFWKVMDTCWKNEIFVIQKPTNIGMIRGGHKVKLNLEINGRIVKFGTMEFRQNTKELNDKIEEIYRSRYELIS